MGINSSSQSSSSLDRDEHYMRVALLLAKQAQIEGEVPVGALVVCDDEIIGQGWNQPIGQSDPCAHAEIMAIRQAAAAIGNYRLTGMSLYVTLEPCAMCAGAMTHARIKRLIYATPDPRSGAVSSVMAVINHAAMNHHMQVCHGVRQKEAMGLLQSFFASRRGK